jgi:excisionase family DNA binding protein
VSHTDNPELPEIDYAAERRRHLEHVGTSATYDTEEAASVLKVHPKTVEELIDSRAILAAKIGRKWVLLRKDVLAYLEQQIVAQMAQRMGGGPVRRKRLDGRA